MDCLVTSFLKLLKVVGWNIANEHTVVEGLAVLLEFLLMVFEEQKQSQVSTSKIDESNCRHLCAESTSHRTMLVFVVSSTLLVCFTNDLV